MAFSSIYGGGGANAQYTADFGGGGGGSLQGQLNAMANFDPSRLINAGWARQDWLSANDRRRAEKERSRPQLGQAPKGRGGMPESLDARVMRRADTMQAQDPNWMGMLSSGNLRHKWLPYATQLEGIQLPNGWDQYAKLAASGGLGFNPGEANFAQTRADTLRRTF